MNRPTGSYAGKRRKKKMTTKHALDRTTKGSSMSDTREVSVEWWVGSLVSAG